MSKAGQNLSFKYNDSGIRTQKTVNGVTTKYTLNGDKVTLEDNGTDKIYYSYDAAGNLVSMNLNCTEYYYIRNVEGDMIALINDAGTQVVGNTYDSWGKLITTTGSLASTVGVKNPYLYRGYRSDSETGLYYLQSRYYSPDWGRFVNADDLGGKVGELLSHNVFVYCGNNPITREDPDEHFWQIIGAVVGAVGGAVIAGALTDWDWRYMLAGAAAGALVGAGLGYLAESAYGAIAAGAAAIQVSNGTSSGTLPMNIVRTLEKGEKIKNIINEAKQLTFETGNEHALVRLKDGARALVSGGGTGISFAEGQISRIIGHTHPYDLLSTGPSAADFNALRALGQASSYLIEHGTVIKFFARR